MVKYDGRRGDLFYPISTVLYVCDSLQRIVVCCTQPGVRVPQSLKVEEAKTPNQSV